MEDPPPTLTIEEILNGMQNPAAYPHPVHSLHYAQTHCSCVFLTGETVYKVKKPVNFGFLDYSTLERRHHFCEQEVALNRRLCPDIYLDVVPITRRERQITVGGSGEPVEWAVRMRQMRESEMLSARLATDTVSRAEIEKIARLLADFHACADCAPAIRAFGDLEVIRSTFQMTLDVMDKVAREALPAEMRQAIRGGLEDFLCREERLLKTRRDEGKTRACHGDLRAQNICLDPRFQDGIQIFDCIEFNEEFRYIDVAADIAYLAADLDFAGRADLREALIDTYRKATGDETLLRVLPAYQSYRAIVRGNIALLAAAEPEIPEDEHQRQRALADAAYDLAFSTLYPRPRPALLITVGLSGSGKSALAQELSRRLPAVRLASDHIRKELAGVSETTTLTTDHYTQEQRGNVYEELRRRAVTYLQRGEHTLLDATFLSETERGAAGELARSQKADFWIVECLCPDSVIRERLQTRQETPNASDADLAVYEQQRQTFQPLQLSETNGPATTHLLIETDQPLPQSAREVVRRFATRGAPCG